MADREKVINGLETCISACHGNFVCLECKYSHDYDGGCEANLLQDALALLKAQELCGDCIDRKRLKDEIQYYIDEAGWGEEINKALGWCLEFIDNQSPVVPAVALKVQEPRVMTLEEVATLTDGAVVWVEYRDIFDSGFEIGLKPAIYQANNSDPEGDGYFCLVSTWERSGFYHKDGYSVDWRCWTSLPTDEQREATPWNPCSN